MARGDPPVGYLTPSETPEERLCRSFSIPNSPEWLGVFMGACYVLTQESSWRKHGLLTPEECAAIAQIWFDDAFYGTTVCQTMVQTPYWDSETSVDDEAPSDDQPWYGFIEDFLAPIEGLTFVENAAVWVITGFVAYAATPGAAIFFRTVARRFVLAVQVQDVGEIIRVVVDASDYHIDTAGHDVGEIIELDVLVTDPDLETHDIYVINTGIPE